MRGHEYLYMLNSCAEKWHSHWRHVSHYCYLLTYLLTYWTDVLSSSESSFIFIHCSFIFFCFS